jgi:hypothetical protein
MSRIRVFLITQILSMALASAFPGFAAAAPAKVPPVAGLTRPTASDAQLEAAIRTKLTKSKIGKDGFRFHVQHGTVTWEGNTAVAQHKGAATRMARTSGAAQVINNIKVLNSGKDTPMRKALVEP